MRCKQYIVPEPKLESVTPDRGTILLPRPTRYISDGNTHHWTTTYVWENIIPRLSTDFNLPFKSSGFSIVANIVNGEDFSYHTPNIQDSGSFTLFNLLGRETVHFNSSALRSDATRCDVISPYHALFIGAHKTCVIKNDMVKNGRTLLLNCDSMAIPLVPVLTHYFEKIIHLDSRDHMDIKIPSLFEWAEITDYMALFTTMSWFVYSKPQRQLHPYVKLNT